MKAVVMAGGAGSRLRPLTVNRPKPMVPIVNKPVLGHILDLLKSYGITEVIITLRYLASMVQNFFEDGASIGMKLTYVVEDGPLGTAGSVIFPLATDRRSNRRPIASRINVTSIDISPPRPPQFPR